jgi:hypothetical protein
MTTATIAGNLRVDEQLIVNPTLVYSTSFLPGLNIACDSSTGQFVSICASGCIYASSNSGATFTFYSFPYDVTSISINSTGQYQCASTYGGATSVGLVSNNYGESWIEIPLGATSLTNYFLTCCVSPDGKYMLFAGVLVTPYISNNFGDSFSNNGSVDTETIMSSTMKQDGTALMSNFVTVASTTKLYTLNCTGTSFVFTFITKTSGGKGRSAITTNLAGLYFFCNDNLASFQRGNIVNNSGFNINCEGLVLHTTSIYFRSATAVYFAPDHTSPSTRSIIYNSTPPRSMAGTSDNSVLYILDTSGNIISIRSSVVTKTPILRPSNVSLGSTIRSELNTVAFGLTQNKITGTSLLIHAGLWGISLKWKITKNGSNIDTVNGINYVKYGISNSSTDFELFSQYREFNYNSENYRTWEEYADSFILNVSSTKSLYLNAVIDNNDPNFVETRIFMKDCLITATLIQP